MTVERRQQIESVCAGALSKAGPDRAAFLDAACGSDAALRRGVESLLAGEGSAEGFLDTPAWQAGTLALLPGARLGPYEIRSAIGAGGMGEVYKARDTRLGRDVAIKILPPEFSADPDRRARFEREARTIASLNHPHICTLHDVGAHPSTGSGQAALYLVMEHLQGQTLAERLAKGPLPLEQALTVATEIADALSAAHRQGVIHRDLKPGNVMLTKAGGVRQGSPQAKLLDFGLAKLTGHGEQAAAASLASAPTHNRPLTSEGAIVGTLQYMAPEQVEGKPADARTDLWALGAILYEMLTGKRAFAGDSAANLIGNIMNAEPPAVGTLQPLTPPSVDRLVRSCLAKDPNDRWDSAHDVADELRWIAQTAATGADRPWHAGPRLVGAAIAAALLIFAAGAGLMWFLRPAEPAVRVHSSFDVRPAADEVNAGGYQADAAPGGSRTALTWTPDGQALVFVGRRNAVQQLYVRRLGGEEARPLAGTEGAQVPAVSHDGRWVAFWSAGAIRRMEIGGGSVMDLATGLTTVPYGMAWDETGRLLFGRGISGIWQIPPGGAPAAVTTVGETDRSHVLPCPLPGGRTMLYTVRKREWSWGDEAIVAHTLATGERKVLLRDAADARYLPSGHLVFLRRGKLFAVGFDAWRLEVQEPEMAVLDNVVQALTGLNSVDVTGAGQFAVAPTGSVAWIRGSAIPHLAAVLAAVDRRGQATPLPGNPQVYSRAVRLSPDGRESAVSMVDLTERGLWLSDLARGTVTPLARGGEVGSFVWRPDGRRIAFIWLKDGRYSLWVQPADGTADPQRLLPGRFYPSSWSRDGRELVGLRADDIVVATVDSDKPVERPLFETPHEERWPELSPDGRWLAYGSNKTGRSEVYVRPYPGPGEESPVSIDGGISPAWNPLDGNELFFLGPVAVTGKRSMMVAEFSAGAPKPLGSVSGALNAAEDPRIGRPKTLFEFDGLSLGFVCTPVRCYDVSSDGQRFYVMLYRPAPPRPPVTHIDFIQNWVEEVKAKLRK